MMSPKKKLNPNQVIHKSVKDLANLLKSALRKLNIVIANKQIVRVCPLTRITSKVKTHLNKS